MFSNISIMYTTNALLTKYVNSQSIQKLHLIPYDLLNQLKTVKWWGWGAKRVPVRGGGATARARVTHTPWIRP